MLAPRGYDAALEHLRGHGFDPHEEVFPRYDRSRSLYVDDPDG